MKATSALLSLLGTTLILTVYDVQGESSVYTYLREKLVQTILVLGTQSVNILELHACFT